MDLESIKEEVKRDEEPVVVPIFSKKGEPYVNGETGEPCTISVLGIDSGALKKVDRKIRSMNRAKVMRDRDLTEEEIAQRRILRAAAVCVGWSGWVEDGRPAEFSREAVERLFAIAPHILRQVEAAVESHADFFEQGSGL